MGRQRFTAKQIIAKLREVEVLVGRGATAVEQVRRAVPASERRTCLVLSQNRSAQRRPRQDGADEQRLTADIIVLATDYGRYGYRRVHALLADAGWRVSPSVVERIWQRSACNQWSGIIVSRKPPRVPNPGWPSGSAAPHLPASQDLVSI